ARPGPLQHHPSGHRRYPAPGAVPHGCAPQRIRDGHSARPHRDAARDRQRGVVPRQRRLVVHDRRRAHGRRRLYRRLTSRRRVRAARGVASAGVTPRVGRRADVTVAAAAAIVALLLAVFVVWPVVRVLGTSLTSPTGLTLAHYAEFFGSPRLSRILVNSLVVSAVSTVITVALALVLAYAVTRTTIPGKRFVSLMSLLPLISPPFILLLGRNGVLTHGLGLSWSIYGFTGIVVSQVFTFLPQAYILLANVLGNIDTSLEEAAENLGAGTLRTLSRVTLALAR